MAIHDVGPGDPTVPADGRLRRAARAGVGATGRAARAVGRQLDALASVGGPRFRDLAVSHAASVAGDAAVAIALAGTLFFQVPSTQARGNVALYLLLTVAPFAVLGPGLGALLERRPGAYRVALAASAGGRVVLAAVLVVTSSPLVLLPTAFGLLVLSRLHGISRNALLPVALDTPLALVAANARMAQLGVLAGVAVAPVAAGLAALLGPDASLVVAVALFVVAAVSGRRLAPATTALRDRAATTAPSSIATPLRIPREVRLAQLATAGVRVLNGFLLLLLAFAFRDVDAPLVDFGAVLGAAGAGYGLAALVSPALERRLREQPMVVAALALEAGAAFAAGQWFGLPAAAALAAAAGLAWGTAKLAFDGLLQRTVPAAHRATAFTRAETLYQLAWVAGALLPTAVMVSTEIGLVLAGFAALAAQVVYVSKLLLDA
ncbi:MAG: hypothetical protein ACLGIR_02060 [Actinomycetes bacterium]